MHGSTSQPLGLSQRGTCFEKLSVLGDSTGVFLEEPIIHTTQCMHETKVSHTYTGISVMGQSKLSN